MASDKAEPSKQPERRRKELRVRKGGTVTVGEQQNASKS